MLMYLQLTKRMLLETDKRLLWKFIWLMGFKGLRSVQRHKARLRKGEFFPPFLYLSVINSCNLRCQGCWVDVAAPQHRLEPEALERILVEAKEQGNSFFGILGGEPLMYKGLLDVLERHQDAYFQLFTNGHFLTDEVASRMHRSGNITPLISIEGTEIISDQRRGRPDVWSKSMAGLQNALKHKLMVGVCTSVCQTNFDDLVRAEWVDRLIEMGVLYCWFHVYRPVGPESKPELTLTSEQQRRVRQFVVDTRATKPIVVIDAYHDGDGQALCPAATGFTHHIGPWGDIEPCPVIQMAKESVHDHRPLRDVFNESAFLRDFRQLAAEHTRGCIIMERPDVLVELAAKHRARDTTARKEVLKELASATPHRSQYQPGAEIPERSWAYRLAKRIAFNDFGTYARHFQVKSWKDPHGPPVNQSSLPILDRSTHGQS
jgi:MoaA/NifB/PqqE/SkfB family radical SAM enzyme